MTINSFNRALLTPCPILRPTEKEFEDPVAYLSRPDVAKLGDDFGIVKVVPPQTWKPEFSLSNDFKFHTRLQILSDLGITSRSRRSFKDNLNRYLKMIDQRPVRSSFVTKDHNRKKVYYYDLYQAVQKISSGAAMDEHKWNTVSQQFGIVDSPDILRHEYEDKIASYALFLNSSEQYFPDTKENEDNDNCMICDDNSRPTETLLCDNCDSSFHMSCLNPPMTEVPLSEWFCEKCLVGTGEYGFEEETDVKYSLAEFYDMCKEFEAEFCEEYNNGEPLTLDIIEKKFWEFVDIEKSDLEVKYGADIHHLKPGHISGFPMENTPGLDMNNENVQRYVKHPWNLTRLPFAKGSLLNFVNRSISGMTVPWIYVGSLLSTFCWHVEDHYTLSANYCHFGATKKWYGIPSKDADKFEQLMRDSAPDLFKRQPDLLHQLVTLISPMKLIESDIRCVEVEQQPNEIVITYPRVYHAGFNSGFNFNEAVNFTISKWLEFGEKLIEDYRKIKKENVFNHFQLVENVLKSYCQSTLHEGDFVRTALSSYENFIGRQFHMMEIFRQAGISSIKSKRNETMRSFEEEQNGVFHDETEDDELCGNCRTHIGYQYFDFDNKARELKKEEEEPIKEEAVLVDEIHEGVDEKSSNQIDNKALFTTPEIKQEGFESTKLSVRQLLTPQASPQEIIIKRRLSDTEEYQNDHRDEEEHLGKRRKSSRIQKLEKEQLQRKEAAAHSIARMYHKTNNDLLDKQNRVRLCLQCCYDRYGQEVPKHGQLVVETSIEDLRDLIQQVKRRLERRNGVDVTMLLNS